MRVHTALSELSDTRAALAEASAALREGLEGEPDVALVFLTPHHAGSWSRTPAMLTELLPHTACVGTSAAGVVGEGHEAEQRCALSMMGLRLDGLRCQATHLDPSALPATDTDWSDLLGADRPTLALVLGDPLSADLTGVLPALDKLWPGTPVVGGLASGGNVPGAHALFAGGRCHRIGTVVVALYGAFEVRTVVAQGCRPIGEPMLVTKCDKRVIRELGGTPPVEVLRELYASLDARDQALFRHSLFAGVEMRGDQVEYKQGDFLVRQITGMDPDDGAIAIAAEVRPWQVVQFQLRDARTSAEDLKTRLAPHSGADVRGVLMCSCVGRGLHLYERPDHDTDLVAGALGDVAVGGFFGNGEIGPVGDATFMHGYTTVLALLCPAT